MPAVKRPRIQKIIEKLLDVRSDKRILDIVGELAYPLPTIVIAEMIGVPSEDHAKLKRWSDDLATFLAPGLKTPTFIMESLASWQEMEQYLQERKKSTG